MLCYVWLVWLLIPSQDSWLQDSGFRIQDSGFRIQEEGGQSFFYYQENDSLLPRIKKNFITLKALYLPCTFKRSGISGPDFINLRTDMVDHNTVFKTFPVTQGQIKKTFIEKTLIILFWHNFLVFVSNDGWSAIKDADLRWDGFSKSREHGGQTSLYIFLICTKLTWNCKKLYFFIWILLFLHNKNVYKKNGIFLCGKIFQLHFCPRKKIAFRKSE